MTTVPMFIIDNQEALAETNDEPISYLIAENGLFIRKQNIIFDIIQPHFKPINDRAKVGGLISLSSKCIYKLPNFDERTYRIILSFFKQVYDKFDKAEAWIYLGYNQATQEFAVIPVKQEVSPGAAHQLETPEVPEGFKLVGTCHSHGDMTAFHSGADDKDQSDFDGIHITFGTINTVPTFNARIYCNGTYYNVADKMFLPQSEEYDVPEEWFSLVTKKVYTPKVTTSYPTKSYVNGEKKTNTTTSSGSKEEQEKIEKFANKIMAMLKENENIKTRYTLPDDKLGVKVAITEECITVTPLSNNSALISRSQDVIKKLTTEENRSWLLNAIRNVRISKGA